MKLSVIYEFLEYSITYATIRDGASIKSHLASRYTSNFVQPLHQKNLHSRSILLGPYSLIKIEMFTLESLNELPLLVVQEPASCPNPRGPVEESEKLPVSVLLPEQLC